MRPLARRDRGSALVIACLLVILIIGMAAALLQASATDKNSTAWYENPADPQQIDFVRQPEIAVWYPYHTA